MEKYNVLFPSNNLNRHSSLGLCIKYFKEIKYAGFYLNTKANERHQHFNKISEGAFAVQIINHKILCVPQINMTVF